MSAIITRTFAEGTKQGLQIANEEFVRKISYPGEWNILRILFSYAIEPSGISNIANSRMVVGLVSGTISGRTYNSANTTNFLGVMVNHTNEGTGQTLTYNDNSGNPYYSQGVSRGRIISRVGNVSSSADFVTDGGTVPIPATTGTIKRRAILLVDIFRPTTLGSGTANWRVRLTNSEQVSADIQKEQLYMCLGLIGAQTDPGASFNSTPVTDAPVNPDEATNGLLDTVSIFWNQQNFPLEVYELVTVRVR